ncbi:MAG TPA: hypothetical protein VMI75_36860 [Polyangiaceae bacterium]|nr:hypothetical protein [Polyangiaceae bacterium]
MSTTSRRGLHWVCALAMAAAATAGTACGSGSGGAGGFTSGDDGGSEGGASSSGGFTDGGADGNGGFGNSPTVTALGIQPATATITSNNGAKVTQPFKLMAQLSDGSTMQLTQNITWSSDAPAVGSLAATGLYSATGALGGQVHIQAAYKGKTAAATLTVKLVLQQNGANVPPAVQTGLEGATTQDTTTTWAYPYDGTVWPRGLLAPILQWNGGAATDDYYLHIVSSTFELQAFTTATNAPSSRIALDETTWQKFTDSSAGGAQVTVARWDGSAATVVAKQSWTVAPASMRGTIYYWSNNLGRVLRIKPGAAMPDDFANQAPLNDPNQYTQSSCLMTCHTVSADGSTIISGGGVFGGSYDLQTSKPTFYLGGTWGPSNGGASSSSVVRWASPALSPDGKYLVTNAMAEGLAYANDSTTQGFLGMYTSANGMLVPNSGVNGQALTNPAWSPEGSRIVYVDSGDPVSTPWFSAWNDPPPGDLKVLQFDATKNPMTFGGQTLVATGADPNQRINWPSITPDGKWVIYQRGVGADTRSGNADMYFASAVTPNQEVRCAKLDGDGYPFAAGSRDLSWNFEPSFAPVAAGGYYWVVFTSRRTYGNILTGPAQGAAGTAVKQLWIAAIDQNPKPGADPSHPAFHLTGQDESNLAMRGFYSLPPCAQNGQGCQSGTDCCGGYCAGGGDGGAPVCQSMSPGCSQTGDKCNTTSDCCNASAGVTCINHVCSEPTPQ